MRRSAFRSRRLPLWAGAFALLLFVPGCVGSGGAQSSVPVPHGPAASNLTGGIQGFYPANQSTNVSASIVPRIDFIFPMNRSTVTPLLTIAPYQAFAANWSANQTSVSLNFLDPLSNETNYTVELFPGATTTNGTIITTTFWFEFETQRSANRSPPPPPPRPHVTNRFPSPGAVHVGVWSNLTISFDMGMNISSAEAAITFQPEIPGHWIVELAGTFVRAPLFPLAFGTRYTVTVAGNATSQDGTTLGTPLSWNFSTIAAPIHPPPSGPPPPSPVLLYFLLGAVFAAVVACGVVLVLLIRRSRNRPRAGDAPAVPPAGKGPR